MEIYSKAVTRLPKRGERVQLIGQITGDRNYKGKFAQAAAFLRERGVNVWNPAELPDRQEYEWYMERCFESLRTQDAIWCLDDWIYYFGAKREFMRAQELGLMIYPDYRIMYICDPIRARDCGKEHCYIRLWGTDKRCAFTPIPEWARLTPAGEPITADPERILDYQTGRAI